MKNVDGFGRTDSSGFKSSQVKQNYLTSMGGFQKNMKTCLSRVQHFDFEAAWILYILHEIPFHFIFQTNKSGDNPWIQ